MGKPDLDAFVSDEPRLKRRKIKTTRRNTTPAAIQVEEEPVTPAGRVFMQPDLDCYIICTLGFQRLINVTEFKKTLSETLVNHKRFHSVLVDFELHKMFNSDDSSLTSKQLDKRCKKKNKRGRDIWVPVQVDIDAHVSESTGFTDREKAAPQFIQSYVSHLQNSPPMDSSRPLWHCHIVNGTSGIAASHMVIRVHHAFGDGTSLMSLLLACTRRLGSPDQLPSIPVASKKRNEKSLFSRWFLSPILLLWNTIVGVIHFIYTMLWYRDSDSPIKGHGGVEDAKKRIVYSVIDIEDMIVVKDAVKGTVNDVLMGMVAAGLQKYLESRYLQNFCLFEGGFLNSTIDPKNLKGKRVRISNLSKLRVRAAALVNTRGSPGLQELASMLKGGSQNRWGNNVGYVLFPIPLNYFVDPLDHVRAAKTIGDKKKLSLEAYFTYWAASTLMYLAGPKLPAKLTRRVVLQTTLTISNMPGPTEPVTFSGNPIVQMFPIVTKIPQAVSIFLQSYMGKATLVVMAAEDIVPDPEVLCECCVTSLQQMRKSASFWARREAVLD